MELMIEIRLSASAYGMQETPHNKQAGSQDPFGVQE
jgi:hypothetical protein